MVTTIIILLSYSSSSFSNFLFWADGGWHSVITLSVDCTVPISDRSLWMYLAAALENHDCLYWSGHSLEHAGPWLFTHPAWNITLALFPAALLSRSVRFQPDWFRSITLWHITSFKPIPAQRLGEKCKLMPCKTQQTQQAARHQQAFC